MTQAVLIRASNLNVLSPVTKYLTLNNEEM